MTKLCMMAEMSEALHQSLGYLASDDNFKQ